MVTNQSGGKKESHHPLPASEKARRNEIPESLEREKGYGDDAGEGIRPDEPDADRDPAD